MTTKLTLTIDDHLVGEAKAYAKSVNRSLSDLISSYLKTLTKEEKRETSFDSDLNELIGCISDMEKTTSYKSLKSDYLEEKYGTKKGLY